MTGVRRAVDWQRTNQDDWSGVKCRVRQCAVMAGRICRARAPPTVMTDAHFPCPSSRGRLRPLAGCCRCRRSRLQCVGIAAMGEAFRALTAWSMRRGLARRHARADRIAGAGPGRIAAVALRDTWAAVVAASTKASTSLPRAGGRCCPPPRASSWLNTQLAQGPVWAMAWAADALLRASRTRDRRRRSRRRGTHWLCRRYERAAFHYDADRDRRQPYPRG